LRGTKDRQWNKDFWNGLVGPTLKADMDVETWIRGPIAPIADTDGVHKTFDVNYINLGPTLEDEFFNSRRLGTAAHRPMTF
jgi:hypothetical protein